MKHIMVTYTVKPGSEQPNADLVRAVFRELAEVRPDGFRYAAFRLPDSRGFVHLYTDEGSPSGLRALPCFQDFVSQASDRHEQPPVVTTPVLIGDYRTFTWRDV